LVFGCYNFILNASHLGYLPVYMAIDVDPAINKAALLRDVEYTAGKTGLYIP